MTEMNLASIQRFVQYRFVPRRILDGRLTGRHASPQHGQSVEFRDYRQYLPGDEVAHIDWKVFGRSDKLYVKRFEHETQLVVHLLVDASRSMSYDEYGIVRKYDHACQLAAALGLVIMHNQDQVGFGLSRNGLSDYHPPTNSVAHLLQMMKAMRQELPRGTASLADALVSIAGRVRRGGIVVVFSDFWDDLDPFFEAAARVAHVGGELILFHVLHQDEVEPPNWGPSQLRDSETGQTLTVDFATFRQDYLRRLGDAIETLRTRATQIDAQYQFAPTTVSIDQILERFLIRRAKV